MHTQRILVFFLFLCLIFSGCSSDEFVPAPPISPTRSLIIPSTTQPEPLSKPSYWPTTGWRSAAPEEQEMDAGRLAAMLESIRNNRINLHSLLIIRHGYLVSETYFNGYTLDRRHEIFSCTKSVVATLVGIAIDQGFIYGVHQKIMDFFPGRTFQNMELGKEAMTLENVLTMTSGLEWTDTGRAFQGLYASSDWVAHMLDLPMDAASGERWNYCSGCSHLLASSLQQTLPGGVLDFAKNYLFEPLGIQNYDWEVDAQGVPIGGWGLKMTPREMAKLGYLYLTLGRWEDNQVIPAAWVQQATMPRFETDSDSGLRYGYQWWTYPSYGAYAALGRDGQTIFVVPQLDLVVVTTAELDGHGQVFSLIDDYIIPAVK